MTTRVLRLAMTAGAISLALFGGPVTAGPSEPTVAVPGRWVIANR